MKPILLAIGLASLMTLPIAVMRIYDLLESQANHEQAVAHTSDWNLRNMPHEEPVMPHPGLRPRP